uniref:COesterase domain-containing protein n=1 Tax=Rhabditophanes sp. KR3021 TaxID=114890 RepID=A0AC35UFI7_9BILA
MFHIFVSFIVLINFAKCQDANEGKLENYLTLRKLTTGFVEGKQTEVSHYGRRGYIFLGIPYAKAPLDELRFQKAGEVESWTGIKDATKFGLICPWKTLATSLKPDYAPMGEDCLSANVYSSKTCLINGKCPVLVYIHGGSFKLNSPALTETETIVDNFANDETNIVFVSLSYRLGILGQLNLNINLNTSTQNNIQLFDIIEGLKWVQREIANLGGSPSRVTISGHSAGSILSSHISISTKADSLFSQIIFMSGFRYHTTFPDNNENISRAVAEHLGCANGDTNYDDLGVVEEVIRCMKGKSADDLLESQQFVERMGHIINGPFQDNGIGSFFDGDITEIEIRPSSIPMMIGVTRGEQVEGQTAIYVDALNQEKVNVTSLELFCEYSMSSYQYHNLSKGIEMCVEEYKDNAHKTKHIADDNNFFLPYLHQMEVGVKNGQNVFGFIYSYIDNGTAYEYVEELTADIRPGHSEMMPYFIGTHKGIFSEFDFVMRRKLMEPFINFVKTGNPSSIENKFDLYDPKLKNVFDFKLTPNSSWVGMIDGIFNETDIFWNERILNDAGGRIHRSSEKKLIQMRIRIDSLSELHLFDLLVKKGEENGFVWPTILTKLIVAALVIGIIFVIYKIILKRQNSYYERF